MLLPTSSLAISEIKHSLNLLALYFLNHIQISFHVLPFSDGFILNRGEHLYKYRQCEHMALEARSNFVFFFLCLKWEKKSWMNCDERNDNFHRKKREGFLVGGDEINDTKNGAWLELSDYHKFLFCYLTQICHCGDEILIFSITLMFSRCWSVFSV